MSWEEAQHQTVVVAMNVSGSFGRAKTKPATTARKAQCGYNLANGSIVCHILDVLGQFSDADAARSGLLMAVARAYGVFAVVA